MQAGSCRSFPCGGFDISSAPGPGFASEPQPPAAYYLAQVLAARGNVEDARKLVQMALNTPGPFLAREQAKEWLDQQGEGEPKTDNAP